MLNTVLLAGLLAAAPGAVASAPSTTDIDTSPGSTATAAETATATATPMPTPMTDAGTAGPRTGKRVRRSIANTLWPVEPALDAGFLLSEPAILPTLTGSIFVPILPSLGPIVSATVSGAGTPDSTFVSGFAGVGLGLETRMGDLRARVAAIPSVFLDHLAQTGGGETLAGVGLLLPLEVGIPITDGLSFTGKVALGAGPDVAVLTGDVVESGRDRFFVMAGAGLNFGGPVD